MSCRYSFPANIGNLHVVGDGTFFNGSLTVADGGSFSFQCPVGEQLIHNNQPSQPFNLGCYVPPGETFRSFYYDVRCEDPNSSTPMPTSAPTTDAPTAAPTLPPIIDEEAEDRSMDNNDCRIAYTELASNGVVGYRPTTISSDDTAFAFRMPVEEHGGGDPSHSAKQIIHCLVGASITCLS